MQIPAANETALFHTSHLRHAAGAHLRTQANWSIGPNWPLPRPVCWENAHAERVPSRTRSVIHRAGRFFRAVAGWTREGAYFRSAASFAYELAAQSKTQEEASSVLWLSCSAIFFACEWQRNRKGVFIVPHHIRLTVQTIIPSWWFTAHSVFLHRMHGKFPCAAAFPAKFCPARPRFCKLLLPENRGTNAVRPKGRTA